MLTVKYRDEHCNETIISGVDRVSFHHDDEHRASVTATLGKCRDDGTPETWTFGPAQDLNDDEHRPPLQIYVMNEEGRTVGNYELYGKRISAGEADVKAAFEAVQNAA